MKLLSKRSSSRTSITARSINEGKELSYQMLYNEVQRLADEEANKKAAESIKRGQELVKKMIKDGFIPDKITYDNFRKDYEKQLISGYKSFCKVVGLNPNDKKSLEWYYYSSTLKDKTTN